MEDFKSVDYQGRTYKKVENNNKFAFYTLVFGIVLLIIYMTYERIILFY